MPVQTLIDLLKKHEGLRLKPYKDTTGKLTIGFGRNLDDNGITENEALYLLKNDMETAINDIKTVLPFFNHFSENRKYALISMMFNLGRTRFSKFENMIAAITVADWNAAATHALDSKWATQVGARANEIAELLKSG